ncbi:hypothetical protein RJ640_009226 [Escallonia rubra]|uniref:Uncharacterized protein n=1 Tax=Escallonia rubra TaxID=112253 RepID=A0AA88QQ12_9ASTE|nr:hypothetical protein RJ640_009226 [Escallonia rubra]
MPKKNSSKAPKSTPTNLVTEQEEKPSATPKRPSSNEIDEIFASKKKKNSQQAEGNKLGPKPKEMKKTKKKDGDEGHRKQKAVVDHAPPPRPRKKMGDGLVVYTEEELGIGKEDAGELKEGGDDRGSIGGEENDHYYGDLAGLKLLFVWRKQKNQELDEGTTIVWDYLWRTQAYKLDLSAKVSIPPIRISGLRAVFWMDVNAIMIADDTGMKEFAWLPLFW